MASNSFRCLTAEQALLAREGEDGFRCVRLADTSFPVLEGLKSEVRKAIEAGKHMKRVKDLEDTEKKASLETAGISA